MTTKSMTERTVGVDRRSNTRAASPTSTGGRRRLAELAQRQQASYLAFLAEVLAVEVDQRVERRKKRRVTEAKFPRMNAPKSSI